MTAVVDLISIAAAIAGVVGTWLLARKGERAGWGFVAYLASNTGWIAFAWIHHHWAMLAQQIVFTVVAIYGAWTWLLAPWLERKVDQLLEGSPWA